MQSYLSPFSIQILLKFPKEFTRKFLQKVFMQEQVMGIFLQFKLQPKAHPMKIWINLLK
ncbi:hypothetical protein ANHYDRO_00267 [Anaerococcus hydrogenalis DSM 7454]|uniref:Uncharacterized protein n=1 Tax=Anaerococcus hydrogenalis DSM 7454 TaxID=561177 RepID=B6W6T3_9FIRM|nr:hypothetical protein ANHYDRO_00267 [Anaerococcus hydrogenalis DSM 7454]